MIMMFVVLVSGVVGIHSVLRLSDLLLVTLLVTEEELVTPDQRSWPSTEGLPLGVTRWIQDRSGSITAVHQTVNLGRGRPV